MALAFVPAPWVYLQDCPSAALNLFLVKTGPHKEIKNLYPA
jgi:hypothetical protein